MRKIIYSMMVSLDGFVEGPKREIDWIYIDEELHTYVNDQQSAIGTYLYGRRMYQLMADYWPTADTNPSAPPVEVEFANIWKSMPKLVFSTTLEKVGWNSRLVRDNIAEEMAQLKAQPGKDLALGGATIASTFIRLALVDEFHLFLQPIILGHGTPYLPPMERFLELSLLELHRFASGVVFLRYQRKTEAQPGIA